jgi:D-tyrosyl-tRNA(Tyr) deacylase
MVRGGSFGISDVAGRRRALSNMVDERSGRGRSRAMRVVIQRVKRASVAVAREPDAADDEREVVGSIDAGYAALVGVAADDSEDIARAMGRKTALLRIMDDARGRIGGALDPAQHGVLAIPNFTLCADARKGRRPSFEGSAKGETAQRLFDAFCDGVRTEGVRCATGEFGADMLVVIANDGPVTIVLDSRELSIGA